MKTKNGARSPRQMESAISVPAPARRKHLFNNTEFLIVALVTRGELAMGKTRSKVVSHVDKYTLAFMALKTVHEDSPYIPYPIQLRTLEKEDELKEKHYTDFCHVLKNVVKNDDKLTRAAADIVASDFCLPCLLKKHKISCEQCKREEGEEGLKGYIVEMDKFSECSGIGYDHSGSIAGRYNFEFKYERPSIISEEDVADSEFVVPEIVFFNPEHQSAQQGTENGLPKPQPSASLPDTSGRNEAPEPSAQQAAAKPQEPAEAQQPALAQQPAQAQQPTQGKVWRIVDIIQNTQQQSTGSLPETGSSETSNTVQNNAEMGESSQQTQLAAYCDACRTPYDAVHKAGLCASTFTFDNAEKVLELYKAERRACRLAYRDYVRMTRSGEEDYTSDDENCYFWVTVASKYRPAILGKMWELSRFFPVPVTFGERSPLQEDQREKEAEKRNLKVKVEEYAEKQKLMLKLSEAHAKNDRHAKKAQEIKDVFSKSFKRIQKMKAERMRREQEGSVSCDVRKRAATEECSGNEAKRVKG